MPRIHFQTGKITPPDCYLSLCPQSILQRNTFFSSQIIEWELEKITRKIVGMIVAHEDNTFFLHLFLTFCTAGVHDRE